MRTFLPFGCLLLAGSLFSQSTQVVPASLTNVDGPGSTAWPFGLASACRVQNFFGGSEIGRTTPILIRSIEVRAQATATNAAKSMIDLQIGMSTSPVTVANVSSTFASNRGSNHKVVYNRKMTSIAATTPATPGQYGGTWMLDTPFLYDPRQGSLLIEYDVSSQPTGTWSHDTAGTVNSGTHSNVGTGCNGLTASSTGGGLGLTLTYTMAGGPANGVALLLVGFTEFPTPIPVPGNPSCFLYSDFPLIAIVNLTAAGAGSATLPLPHEAGLRGQAVYGQYVAVIPSPARLDTTQSRKVVLEGFLSARIYDTTSNTTTTGSVQLRSAVVVRLGL